MASGVACFELSAFIDKDGSTAKSYAMQVDEVKKTLGYNSESEIFCGPIKTELVTVHQFIKLNSSIDNVILVTSAGLLPQTYSDSVIRITAGPVTVDLGIIAKLEKCVINELKFEPSFVSVEYNIGSGAYS